MSGRKAYSQEEQPFPCENPRCPKFSPQKPARDWYCSKRCRAVADLERDLAHQLDRINIFLASLDA